MKIKSLLRGALAALAMSVLMPAVASADTLAGWDFTTNGSGFVNNTAAGTVGTGVSNALITRNGSVSVNTATYSFDSKGFTGNTADNVQVGFTTSTAYTVSDLLFSAFSSGTGPGSINVYASVDGGAAALLQTISVGTASGTSATNYDVVLNQAVTSSLQVFLSANGTTSASGGALGSGGTFRLNNPGDVASTLFRFEGTASPVPAPGVVPASVLALVGGVIAIRRRKSLAL